MQGNEIRVGSGAYSIGLASSPTSITLVNQTDKSTAQSFTYSTNLSSKNGSIVPRNQYTTSKCYSDSFDFLNGNYIKNGQYWYKCPSTPSKILGSPTFVNGTAEDITLIGAEQDSVTIEYCDSVSISQGEIVEVNSASQVCTKSSDFTFLCGKVLKQGNAYYQIAASATTTTKTVCVNPSVSPYADSSQSAHNNCYNVGDTINYSESFDDITWSAIRSDGYKVAVFNFSKTYTVSSCSDAASFFKNKGYYVKQKDSTYYVRKVYSTDYGLVPSTSTPIYEVNLWGDVYDNSTSTPSGPSSLSQHSFLGKDAVFISGQKKSIEADSYSVVATTYLCSAVSAPQFTFKNNEILSISGEKAVNLSGDELSIDTFTPEVIFNVSPRLIFKPSDYDGFKSSDGYVLTGFYTENLRELAYGAPINYYHDGRLIGTYYNKNVERTAKSHYTINAMSLMGMLDMQYHKGGVYVNETFGNIIAEILGNMSITVESSVANTRVTGWLPYDTCRNNLHQLLFATNAVFVRSDSGDMVFTYLLTDPSTEEIPDSRIFENGSVEYSTPCSKLEVTEHTYEAISTVDRVTVFDNTEAAAVTDKKVIFNNAPVIASTFVTSGTLTVSESNCNYAVVTGQGTLTAIPYTHITYVVSKTNANASEERIVTCDDATLVSTLNSEKVASRLMSYYGSARTIKSGIKLDGERCGTRYIMKDGFGDSADAYLTKMSYNVTTFVKADCEFIADYSPYDVGNNYTSAVLLTKADETALNGTWTSPKTGTIKVTLIGGGNGASSGYAGASAVRDVDAEYENSEGGEGGVAGTKGNGGYIYSVDVSVTEGQQIAFHIGSGSAGGAQCTSHTANNNPTAEATHAAGSGATTFGSYSSATGGSVSSGVMNLFNGAIYGLPGSDGVDGGAGGAGGYHYTENYPEKWNGIDGTNVTYNGNTYYGGSGGAYLNAQSDGKHTLQAAAYIGGTGGGGAAVGNNGGNGDSATNLTIVSDVSDDYNTLQAIANYGKNGQGADAIAADDATMIGGGGSAGHGGGGQGGFAGQSDNPIYEYDDGTFSIANTLRVDKSLTTTRAGYGGKGGDGYYGGILIYI